MNPEIRLRRNPSRPRSRLDPFPAELVLAGRPAGREVLEAAAARLAPCLVALTSMVERELLDEREDLRRWARANAVRGMPAGPVAAELDECRRSLRRLRRVARRPLPEARRQVSRLARFLEGGEVRSLRLSSRSVIGRVEPVPLSEQDRAVPPFDICFVPRDRTDAPIVIECEGPSERTRWFTRLGTHGMCRGDAEDALRPAMEQADVVQMFHVAFSWALANLR